MTGIVVQAAPSQRCDRLKLDAVRIGGCLLLHLRIVGAGSVHVAQQCPRGVGNRIVRLSQVEALGLLPAHSPGWRKRKLR